MQGLSYKHCLLSLFFILFLDKPSHLQTNLKFVRIFNSVLCYFVNVRDMCNIDSFPCFFTYRILDFLFLLIMVLMFHVLDLICCILMQCSLS